MDDILIVSLSNIGDVVLTCPVIDVLLHGFPQARLDVIVGKKTKGLFDQHPRITAIEFDKTMDARTFIQWIGRLRAKKYTMVVDLRQTLFPLLLRYQQATPLLKTAFAGHSRDKHLHRLKTVFHGIPAHPPKQAIVPKSCSVVTGKDYVVIAPTAADRLKCWSAENFTRLAQELLDARMRLVWVGSREDRLAVEGICASLQGDMINAAGELTLRELADVFLRCRFAVTHDSGPMHLASYFDVPVVALWGPTDINTYGPWSTTKVVVRAQDKTMGSITVNRVVEALNTMGLLS